MRTLANILHLLWWVCTSSCGFRWWVIKLSCWWRLLLAVGMCPQVDNTNTNINNYNNWTTRPKMPIGLAPSKFLGMRPPISTANETTYVRWPVVRNQLNGSTQANSMGQMRAVCKIPRYHLLQMLPIFTHTHTNPKWSLWNWRPTAELVTDSRWTCVRTKQPSSTDRAFALHR